MRNKTKTINKKGGFSILEVMSAIFILSVGMGGALSLMNQTLSAASVVKQRVTASYLAQEGIEIVRNIRDTNWLQSRGDPSKSPWDDGLDDGSCSSPTPCQLEVDYKTTTFFDTTYFEKCIDSGSNCKSYTTGTFLNIDTDGFYGYEVSDAQTKFKRKITIDKPQADKIEVTVEVIWEERGRAHSFIVLERITNWYEK